MANSAKPRRVRIQPIKEIKTADALDRYQEKAILAATPALEGSRLLLIAIAFATLVGEWMIRYDT